MAKTRAQRKAERRAREAEEQKRSGAATAPSPSAQHDTQVPGPARSPRSRRSRPGSPPARPRRELETPDAPQAAAPPAAPRREAQKEAEERRREEQKRREREQLAQEQKQAKAERQRGGVIGFLVSCWAELKKVQWPDRETLIQATAVTIIFVAVAAAYLGALDAVFNFLIKRIL